jgi:AraC-like DNA-binding protein
MVYQVFPPSGPLVPFVDSYYVLEGNPWALPQRVKLTPTGSSGLIIQYGPDEGRIRVSNDIYADERLSESFIFGQLRKYAVLEVSGATKMLGVHFKPAGFYHLFGRPMALFTDQGIDIEWGLGRAAAQLTEQVREAQDAAERVEVVDGFLLAFLRKGPIPDSVTDGAVHLLQTSQGNMPITGLAQTLGVSRRTLERKFAAEIGILPKQFASIIRFNAMLNARQISHSSWLDAAYESGYCDQSHLIRQVRLFCGEVPSQLLSDEADDLPGLIQRSCHHRLTSF